MCKLTPSHETLDMERLGKMALYTPPPSYSVSKSMGSGCFGDPPGYPSYFIQHIYTQHGNSPSRDGQPVAVILGHVIQRAGEDYEKVLAPRLRRLWKPLPLDHPRTRAWIESTYTHMRNCYQHEDYPDRYGRGLDTLCTGAFGKFAHKAFKDDPRFSDEWRATEQEAVRAHNAEVDRLWAEIAIPENHKAYNYIRKFYPDHAPDMDLIANPAYTSGDWWEVYAEQPTPENCPGKTHQWTPATMSHLEHPLGGGNWCQVCGWRAETTEQLAGQPAGG